MANRDVTDAPPPDLAPTLRPVADRAGGPRAGLEVLRRGGWRAVQLDACLPGLRPRDLDATARRDLRAVLRRLELAAAGLDFLIPHEDLVDPARADRAVEATVAAAQLAADLGGLALSVHLPEVRGGDAADAAATAAGGVVAHLVPQFERRGVTLADHGPTPAAAGGVGVDPVACLARDEDPVERVLRAGPRLAAVRACDLLPTGARGPLGVVGGRMDVLAYRASLVAAGWTGTVVADVRQVENVAGALAATAAAWRDAVPAGFA